MKTLRKLIELLVAIESGIRRRKANKRATRVAVRMALKGCRV